MFDKILQQKLLAAGYFYTPEQSLDYLAQNSITFTRSNNNAVLFSTTRVVEDSEFCNIDFQYRFGSYFEDNIHRGITHLIEHLWFDEKFNREMSDAHITVNGWTNPKFLNLNISGTYNTDFLQYSIPSKLSRIIEKFYKHDNYTDLEKIYIEKDIVAREISERDTDFYKYSFQKIIWPTLAPNHELSVDTLGSIESLAHISITEIKNFIESRFLPCNSVIKIISEGKNNKHNEVSKYISDFIDTQSRLDDQTNYLIPEYDIENINKNLRTSEFNIADRFKSKVMYLNIKVAKTPIGSKNALIVDKYFQVLSMDLHINSRKHGIAYSTDIVPIIINSEYSLIVSYFICDNTNYRELIPKFESILRDCFESSEEKKKMWEIEIEEEKLRQDSNPISKKILLDSIVDNYLDFGLIPDLHKRRKLLRSISTIDIIEYVDYVKNLENFKITVGDL